jgi:hypothetical protein
MGVSNEGYSLDKGLGRLWVNRDAFDEAETPHVNFLKPFEQAFIAGHDIRICHCRIILASGVV